MSVTEPDNADAQPPKAMITLRRNSDGATVRFLDDWTAYGSADRLSLHSLFWQWTEGSYSCDCNRHLYFHRNSDPPSDPIDAEIPCADEQTGGNQYTLVGIIPLP